MDENNLACKMSDCTDLNPLKKPLLFLGMSIVEYPHKLPSTIKVLSENFEILHFWRLIVIAIQFQITKQCGVLINLTGLFSQLHWTSWKILNQI